MAVVASSGADSFITEGQVEEEVAHGLVGVPYHLAVVATRLSKAQRMMWDKTTTKTSALTSHRNVAVQLSPLVRSSDLQHHVRERR